MYQMGQGLTIATTVLQFVFLAYNGFRFPFAYFLTDGISTGHLITIFWDIMNRLKSAGFLITYVCRDGVATNWSFVNRICGLTVPVTQNIVFVQEEIICIMNFCHVIKKLRNSMYASGLENPTIKDNCQQGMVTYIGNIFVMLIIRTKPISSELIESSLMTIFFLTAHWRWEIIWLNRY